MKGGGHEAVCQQECWASKRVDWGVLLGDGNECQRGRWPRKGEGGGWIVRSHIGWGGERNIFIRVWKPLPSRHVLKTLRESSKGENPKKTISASGELRPLHLNRGSASSSLKPSNKVHPLSSNKVHPLFDTLVTFDISLRLATYLFDI